MIPSTYRLKRRTFLAAAAAGCMSFTARGADARKTRRSDGGPVIDAHAHWYPEEWLKAAEAAGPSSGLKVTRAAGVWSLTGEWTGVPAVTPDYIDLDLRLKKMDRQGVDIHALSLTTPMTHWASPDLGLKLSRMFNDAASQAHSAHPNRFVVMATLPMQAPQLALAELQRAAKLPGVRGIYLPTTVKGKELDDASFSPIYAECERLGFPVFLHPVETIGKDRTGEFYLRNLLGNPYDTGVAAAHLIFGGVLDRFPSLEILLPHAGGTLPGIVGRLDHGVVVRPELKHMKRPASAYLRRFTYDTITHNDALLMNLIGLVGADRVVLGSDYPFDMGYERPVEVVERLKDLSAKDKDQILGKTAARLLRIQA
ncbi:MAG: amidohydrolase family protein [Bryobacteraceae bacterium]|jgi:aminocarboxymuconate-semialdehyde decarboxylase